MVSISPYMPYWYNLLIIILLQFILYTNNISSMFKTANQRTMLYSNWSVLLST